VEYQKEYQFQELNGILIVKLGERIKCKVWFYAVEQDLAELRVIM